MYDCQSGAGAAGPVHTNRSLLPGSPVVPIASERSDDGRNPRNSPTPPRIWYPPRYGVDKFEPNEDNPFCAVGYQLNPKRGLTAIEVGARSLRTPNVLLERRILRLYNPVKCAGVDASAASTRTSASPTNSRLPPPRRSNVFIWYLRVLHTRRRLSLQRSHLICNAATCDRPRRTSPA